jgi:hypothetical protein
MMLVTIGKPTLVAEIEVLWLVRAHQLLEENRPRKNGRISMDRGVGEHSNPYYQAESCARGLAHPHSDLFHVGH